MTSEKWTETAKEILIKLQWSGFGGYEGEIYNFCPICNGVEPSHYDEEIKEAEEINQNPVYRQIGYSPNISHKASRGHKPSCKLYKLIKQ